MLILASSTSSFLLDGFQPLVVVVNRDRQDLLGGVLADHVLIEDRANLVRHRQVRFRTLVAVLALRLLADDVVAQLDALVADENRRTRDQLAHLVLALAAKRAVEQFFAADLVRHTRFRHDSGPLVPSRFTRPLPGTGTRKCPRALRGRLIIDL